MINPKGLRIGNWFKAEATSVLPAGIFQVESLDESGINGTEDYRYGEENVYGILLTPEILERCGFARWQDDTFEKELGISNAMLRVTPGFGPVFIDFTGDPRCLTRLYHVHQLQNLYYALTGEELEVKLKL